MFYPVWEAAAVDEWLYNGGPYQLIVCHFLLGVFCYMGREWELSFRLGMRPWIAVAYSAPVAAATAVFLIYPIGQGSFSDGMPLGKVKFAPNSGNIVKRTLLNGESLSFLCSSLVKPASNVVCSAIRLTKSGFKGPGQELKTKKEQTREFDPDLVEKGLKSLDNPVLRGSFTLVLSNDTMNFLDNIAKQAWNEITARGLRDVTAESPENRTVQLGTCSPNVVQNKRAGVYVIQNVETGMAVIGETTNLKGRFNQYAVRTSRTKPLKGDTINNALYNDVQRALTRFGDEKQVLQRYIVYAWVNEAGQPLDPESRNLKNERRYLEHRLLLAFYECGLAYNTNDSAPQLNDSVALDSAYSEAEPQPIGGN